MSTLSRTLARQAVILEIGGFRPPDDPSASWFGRVNLALPGEEWPQGAGGPMHALCQLNLVGLSGLPAQLQDIQMLTLFIGPKELPVDAPNGTDWCLRAYKDISGLRPLEKLKTSSPIKSLPLRALAPKKDFPCIDDAQELGVDIDDEDEYVEKYANLDGLKLGGWPSLIQSVVSWSDGDEEAALEYVFQIPSSEKAHWSWGHGGYGYLGRGTANGCKDHWALSWQCF